MKDLQIEQEKKTETIVLKPSSNNKDVIQSYILTTARYDFSVYEKRILYRIVECFQSELAGEKLDKGFSISKNLFGDVDIVMPVSSLLVNEEDKNYSRIKKAFSSLKSKHFIYEDDRIWEDISLIERPKIDKYSHTVRFRLYYKVYEALLNFSKGYRKYELNTTMSFKSVYAMRFYELLSGQKRPLTYSIENLRAMFQLENKHKPIRNFVRYVVEPAKRELDNKSPYSFTYELEREKERTNPKGGRKRITGITFTPFYHSDKRNKLLEYKDLCNALVLSDVLLPEEKQFFLSLGFTEQELKNKHYGLILDIYRARRQGGEVITDILFGKVKEASDPKAYVLKSIKNGIRKHRENMRKHQSNRTGCQKTDSRK